MADQGKKEADTDVFILNSLYPDAKQVFNLRLKPLEQIKDDCYVVVDTNALLVPYGAGKESLQQIRRTYTQLAATKRLAVPGQVAREFAKHQAAKISELFEQVVRASQAFPEQGNGEKAGKPLGHYPLLEGVKEYQEAHRIMVEMRKQKRAYLKALDAIKEHIKSWMWDDPISSLYGELFVGDVIFDLQMNDEQKEAFLRDWNWRKIHSIPPGYKDTGKVGDLLIWRTILEIGKNEKRHVIFVSGDVKADWWIRSEDNQLYPRYELIYEFATHSEGQSLHIIGFGDFLKLYGANEKVVEEVKEAELEITLELEKVPGTFGDKHLLEKAPSTFRESDLMENVSGLFNARELVDEDALPKWLKESS